MAHPAHHLLSYEQKLAQCEVSFSIVTLVCVPLLDITGVLLDNKKLAATEEEIGKAIMVYLRNASDRCGGRSRRRTNTADSTESS